MNTEHKLAYKTWAGMKARCYNSKSSGYRSYGGRGIKICDRWRISFAAFLQDMGDRPGVAYSIDRIDPDGNYCPENCRWLTRSLNSSRARGRKGNGQSYEMAVTKVPRNLWWQFKGQCFFAGLTCKESLVLCLQAVADGEVDLSTLAAPTGEARR